MRIVLSQPPTIHLNSRFLKGFRATRSRLAASPLFTRLAKGAFWTVSGTAAARGLGLVGSMLAAHFLSKTSFGELGIIQSTVGLFGTFAGLGLGVTATKFVAEWRDREPARCGHVVVMTIWVALVAGVMACAGLGLASDWLARYTLAAPRLGPVLRESCLLVFFSTLQNVYLGALAGFEAFWGIAVVNLVGGLLGIPLMVLGAMEFGVTGAVFGLVLQSFAGCVAGHAVLFRAAAGMGIRLRFAPVVGWLRDRHILWQFSLPAFLSSTLVGPVNWFCNMELVNHPGGYAQAALLSAANQWKNLVGFLPMMLGSVLVPMLANLHAAGHSGDFIKLLRRQLAFSAGLCLCVSLPLALFSRDIMRCYGADYAEGAPVLALTLWTTAIAAINNLLSKSMQSAGRAWLDLGFSGVWSISLVGASLMLIPQHGAMGVVIAQAVAAGILALWQWRALRRLLLSPQATVGPASAVEV